MAEAGAGEHCAGHRGGLYGSARNAGVGTLDCPKAPPWLMPLRACWGGWRTGAAGQCRPAAPWASGGVQCCLDAAIRHLDRVEVYRPLKVDPKVARRERFARQGARTTGLFARQRPGGKSGY